MFVHSLLICIYRFTILPALRSFPSFERTYHIVCYRINLFMTTVLYKVSCGKYANYVQDFKPLQDGML